MGLWEKSRIPSSDTISIRCPKISLLNWYVTLLLYLIKGRNYLVNTCKILTVFQVEYEFKDWNHTIRYPLNPYFANATSRDDDVNVVIGKQQDSIRDTIYKLLTTYQPYNQVSNRANGGSIGNFESVHDGVHNVFGLGHMGITEVSAFDPVFWFHHWYVTLLGENKNSF